MRIRSIKPEFWRSRDIARLPMQTRLLFIGVWSYVDDNGVGRDEVPLIAADLFAHDLSGDPPETLRRVSTGLDDLSRGGQIVRYEADGQPLLYVCKWEKHQRIQNPAKARFPRPEAVSGDPTETLPPPSGDSPEILGPGAGEQGSRGAGEWAGSPGDGHQGPGPVDNRPPLDPETAEGARLALAPVCPHHGEKWQGKDGSWNCTGCVSDEKAGVA
jgi:hypothetical protein